MISYNRSADGLTITATITNCENDVINKLNKVFGTECLGKKIKTVAKLPCSVSGKAKCHPEDEFDEDTGRKLARKRLLNSYHDKYIKALNRVDGVLNAEQALVMQQIQHVIKVCKKHN